MKNYILQENETILFRGTAILISNDKTTKEQEECDVFLTNLNIVFMQKVKKLFKTKCQVEAYSVKDVKIYDETVQIIRRKSIVDIYLKQRELFVDFQKEKYAKEFCDKALKLISGYSKIVRSVKKTQKFINETNEALDIDIVEIAKGAAKLTCEVTSTVATLNTSRKGTKIAGKFADTLLGKNKNKETQLLNSEQENLD